MDVNFNNLVKDIRTYKILSSNKNYYDRLFEAYSKVKELNIDSYETFKDADTGIGAFEFNEITVFDRIRDENYLKYIQDACKTIYNGTEDYIKNPKIGDELASWGTLGNTPHRQELVEKGYIIEGLTQEEWDKKIK